MDFKTVPIKNVMPGPMTVGDYIQAAIERKLTQKKVVNFQHMNRFNLLDVDVIDGAVPYMNE